MASESENYIKDIVVVGGGSAGWLCAAVLASEFYAQEGRGQITLIESPDIKVIGVGEGTWPTMRDTLRRIGVSETDFVRECDVSFKQGSKFVNWVTTHAGEYYYHPFMLPNGYSDVNLVPAWQANKNKISFADATCYQGRICEYGRAPKQLSTPEFAAVANYGYHLDSMKFGEFLRRHCVEKLGVRHVISGVVQVISRDNGDIESLLLQNGDEINGDLFIDCSGLTALLIDKHFSVPFIEKKNILFNDSALAVQVPYLSSDTPIASPTISTAQRVGWIWDIGLPSRRGVGCVYSSRYINDDLAEQQLLTYLAKSVNDEALKQLSPKKISINPGYRERFWINNCVAVGMSAGFLEPLEASALALVELSASMIRDELPATRSSMDIASRRFNERFRYRWERIIDFLKLHYVLSKRNDSDFWRDNLLSHTISDRLLELLELWQYRPPHHHDFIQVEEVFPSASYHYVLYGMGFETHSHPIPKRSDNADIGMPYLSENIRSVDKYLKGLPSNRELIEHIRLHGLHKI